MRLAFLALITALAVVAQTTPPQQITKTFQFKNPPTSQGLNEMAVILRTVADMRQVTPDPGTLSITATDTPDQIALAGWLLQSLDRLPGSLPPTIAYPVTGKADDFVRFFHPNNNKTPQGISELLTVFRTVADVQRVFSYSAFGDIVIRASAAQMALLDYLFTSLDAIPVPTKHAAPFPYRAPPSTRPNAPEPPDEVVRVFYPQRAVTPTDINEMLTTLRTVADVQKVFAVTAQATIAVRGTSSMVTLSEWIIDAMDFAAGDRLPDATRAFAIPGQGISDPVVHVVYPATPGWSPRVSAVMERVHSLTRKAFQLSTPPVIVVRGSADQVDAADKMILSGFPKQ